jgi:hypothetical protein
MNELQIRLTADIKDLQSAINKAKASLKSFESETATDSEKSNVGFRRKIGLIEQLTAKAKELKVSLSQATNEQQISKFNAELEQTNIELARLNSLGKSFADTSVQSFNKFRVSAGAANGSAIAFNRIIQDAPFGIIGVGNNIQQFAEQLSALRVTTGSTSSALSTFFGSLLTKSNLIVLGISAVTAAFTAYQLGVFDTKKEVDELTKAQEDFNESLKDTNGLLAQGLLNKLLKEVGLLKTENLGGRLVDVPAFETAGQVVDALSGKINNLRKGELELLEGFLNEQISNATRAFANANDSLSKSLATDDINLYRGILEKVNQQLKFYKDVSDGAKESAEGLNRVLDDQILILERFGSASDDARERLEKLLKYEAPEKRVDIDIAPVDEGALESGVFDKNVKNPLGDMDLSISDLQELIANFEKLKSVTTDSSQLAKYTLEIDNLKLKLEELNGEQVKSNLELVADAFGSLASGIVASLEISNRSLRGFLTTLISATPKIIAAMSAQANSNLSNAGKNIAADKAESISSGIKQGTKFAEALGPVGLALLPVLISGAVAVISSAFSKAGSGGSVSSGSGSTYTNRREFGGPVSKGRAYIVGERRPELFVPNTNGVIVPQVPSMDYSAASVNSGMYGVEVMLKGPDDLLFFVEQAQIRRNIR